MANQKRQGRQHLLSRTASHIPACFLLIISACLMTTCSARVSSDELATEMRTISSWAATARRVVEAWLGGSVPVAYAERTLQVAQQQLQEVIDTLSKSAQASTEKGAKVLEQARSLKGIVEQMQSAVRQADQASVGQQLDQISSQQRALRALDESTGAPPR
jgi:hypothetical protein